MHQHLSTPTHVCANFTLSFLLSFLLWVHCLSSQFTWPCIACVYQKYFSLIMAPLCTLWLHILLKRCGLLWGFFFPSLRFVPSVCAVRVVEPPNLGSPGMPSGHMISPRVTTVPSCFLKVKEVKVPITAFFFSFFFYTNGVDLKDMNNFSQCKVSDYNTFWYRWVEILEIMFPFYCRTKSHH